MTSNRPFVFARPVMRRLVLNHDSWPRPTYTARQEIADFSKAIEKAKELRCTYSIETRLESRDA